MISRKRHHGIMGGLMLSLASFVTGYLIHDLINSEEDKSPSRQNSTVNYSAVIDKTRLDSSTGMTDDQIMTSSTKDFSMKRHDQNLQEPEQDIHDELLQELSKTTPVGWDENINYDFPDDPNRMAEVMMERESEYRRQDQILAELDGQLPTATLEPDDDALEDEFLSAPPPEIGAEEALNIIEAEIQASDLLQSDQKTILPHEEEPQSAEIH